MASAAQHATIASQLLGQVAASGQTASLDQRENYTLRLAEVNALTALALAATRGIPSFVDEERS